MIRKDSCVAAAVFLLTFITIIQSVMGSKFSKELQVLVKDKVISPELAEKIEQYYAIKNTDKPNRLFTIFGVFGSLLIGSGIILMLAHNWDNFSRLIKTILAFLPLIIGQLLVGFSIYKEKSITWKEASGTFLFFAVGISISLVSQIYNIPGDLGSFLKIWILLCIPIIYLLRSHSVAFLCLVFSTCYALEIGVWRYRSADVPWLYIVFIVTIIPHYISLVKYKLQSYEATIFNWIVPSGIAIAIGAFLGSHGAWGMLVYITLFGLFYNIGKLSFFRELGIVRNGFLIIGSLGTIITLLIFTFRWVWKELPLTQQLNTQGFYLALMLFSIGLSMLLFFGIKKGIKQLNLFQIAFVIFWGIYFLPFEAEVPTILVNVLVFILGITAIKIGASKFNFGILNYGLLIISVLITCRFFDITMSFVVRGILFVTVGIGFFVTNYLMLKRQKKLRK